MITALILCTITAAYAVHVRTASAGSPSHHWSQAQIVRIIKARFGPVGEARQALCVAAHESTGTATTYAPGAYNVGQDGLFQINQGTWDPALNPVALPIVGPIDWGRIFEPAYNAMVAFRIWRHSGWLPAWTADEYVCGLTN